MRNENKITEDTLDRRKKRAEIIQNLPARIAAVGEPMEQKAAEAIVRSLSAIENENDGRVVIIPVRTIGKIWRHKGFDVSRIFGDLLDLYKTALLGWSEPHVHQEGHKQHSNAKAYHHYINKFTDGKDEYYIRFTVVEERVKPKSPERNILHSSAISNVAIYKKGDHSNRIRVMLPGGESPSPFIDKKLQDFFDLY